MIYETFALIHSSCMLELILTRLERHLLLTEGKPPDLKISVQTTFAHPLIKNFLGVTSASRDLLAANVF